MPRKEIGVPMDLVRMSLTDAVASVVPLTLEIELLVDPGEIVVMGSRKSNLGGFCFQTENSINVALSRLIAHVPPLNSRRRFAAAVVVSTGDSSRGSASQEYQMRKQHCGWTGETFQSDHWV